MISLCRWSEKFSLREKSKIRHEEPNQVIQGFTRAAWKSILYLMGSVISSSMEMTPSGLLFRKMLPVVVLLNSNCGSCCPTPRQIPEGGFGESGEKGKESLFKSHAILEQWEASVSDSTSLKLTKKYNPAICCQAKVPFPLKRHGLLGNSGRQQDFPGGPPKYPTSQGPCLVTSPTIPALSVCASLTAVRLPISSGFVPGSQVPEVFLCS